jgi:hypothetical protein
MMREAGKAWLTRLLAGIGGLVAATISLGYSLFEQRQSGIVPQVEAAIPIEAGRWEVSITAAAIPTVLPNGGRTPPRIEAIAVGMMLENLSAESSNLYGDLIGLVDVPDAPRPQYYLNRDHSILWDLQPRMPERVTAGWEVPASLALSDTLRLCVDGATFKPRDNLYAAPGWFPSGSVAEVALPLKMAAPEAGQ